MMTPRTRAGGRVPRAYDAANGSRHGGGITGQSGEHGFSAQPPGPWGHTGQRPWLGVGPAHGGEGQTPRGDPLRAHLGPVPPHPAQHGGGTLSKFTGPLPHHVHMGRGRYPVGLLWGRGEAGQRRGPRERPELPAAQSPLPSKGCRAQQGRWRERGCCSPTAPGPHKDKGGDAAPAPGDPLLGRQRGQSGGAKGVTPRGDAGGDGPPTPAARGDSRASPLFLVVQWEGWSCGPLASKRPRWGNACGHRDTDETRHQETPPQPADTQNTVLGRRAGPPHPAPAEIQRPGLSRTRGPPLTQKRC